MNDLINRTAAELADAVGRILETDAEMVAGYSRVKARTVARYALLIGEAYALGALTEDELRAEVEELDRMAERFVRNIRALAHTAVERVFAAVAEALRGAIGASALARGAIPPELTLPRL